jgi:hypothetical protein
VAVEALAIGYYRVAFGGWLRHHRDNTSDYTAHRQFAVSFHLNVDGEDDGGEMRFPEFSLSPETLGV